MTKLYLHALIPAALTVLLIGAAAYAKETKCERCGMSWDASATALTVVLKGSKTPHYYESLACAFQSVARDKVSSIKVVDYSAGNTSHMIDATKAHFLYDTERIPHSMPPFIAAFKTKDAALHAQKDLGGDYATFDQVWSKLAAHFKKRGGH